MVWVWVSTLTLCFTLFGLFLNAQSPALSLGNIGFCNNTTVLVPLTGQNLTNIGAITLIINYNDTSLAFNSIENIDPQIEGLSFNVLLNPSRVIIAWSKTSGANFLNSALLNLKFDVLQNVGNLAFDIPNCEIANISLPPQLVDVTYTNGSIFSEKPLVSAEPENKTITALSNVVFQVSSPNTLGFKWQESRNNEAFWSDISETNTYSGTHSSSLTIKQVPLNYSQFRYRCVLESNSCSSVSASAILSVDTIAGIAGQPSHTNFQLSNYPNPFSGKTTIEIGRAHV